MARKALHELEQFARARLAAEQHPQARHVFQPFACERCGPAPFALRIEHHSGTQPGNFRGVIWGRCAQCGTEQRLFSFTGVHRRPQRVEVPRCRCGHASFLAGECLRFEGEDGLPGFFDESVVVGRCAHCGRQRAFVYTD
jgi:hypothetical protein